MNKVLCGFPRSPRSLYIAFHSLAPCVCTLAIPCVPPPRSLCAGLSWFELVWAGLCSHNIAASGCAQVLYILTLVTTTFIPAQVRVHGPSILERYRVSGFAPQFLTGLCVGFCPTVLDGIGGNELRRHA